MSNWNYTFFLLNIYDQKIKFTSWHPFHYLRKEESLNLTITISFNIWIRTLNSIQIRFTWTSGKNSIGKNVLQESKKKINRKKCQWNQKYGYFKWVLIKIRLSRKIKIICWIKLDTRVLINNIIIETHKYIYVQHRK